MADVRYRPNVCIAIKKAGSDQLLMCHRKAFPDELGWQFPQGGIDKTIDLVSEMRRELREEIGTDDVTVLKISSQLYTYDFLPGNHGHHPGFYGQSQRWVLVELNADDLKINFSHEPAEFDAFQWVSAIDVLNKIVDFKKQVYMRAMRDLGLLVQISDFNRFI
jgi:putative (di)nucleoside polyphosphate hydrolase